MKNQLENPFWWAKVSGLCEVLAEDPKFDDEQRSVLELLGGLSGNDMMRLAVGWHDTEWMARKKED